jgi:hypothetical protein
LWDATAPSYWEVSDGERTAVVEVGGRRSGAPCPTASAPGASSPGASREISDEEIRRQVDRALYPGVAADRKLATFAEAFRCLAWNVDPACFEILYDVPGDPTLSVARLPPPALAELGAVAGRIFDRDETEKVVAAFTGSDDDPDRFTVLIRQRVRVEG